MQQSFCIRKAGMPGFWQYFALAVLILFPISARAEWGRQAEPETFQQVVYQETPLASYYAYPDDPNFIPENQFMMRTDSLNYDSNIQDVRQATANANPGAQVSFADRPTIVCRDFGCTKMNDRITRAFLFNSLANLFMMNSHSRVFICEADPFTRACLDSGISFPVRAGVANAMINVPKVTIDQVTLSTGLSKATIGMSYELLINGVPVRCAPTLTDIVVPVNSQATLVSQEFSCSLTTDGYTNVSMMFNIDYIDLDYGILGGYYSLGLQGPAMGGGTGYVLYKLENSNSGMRMKAATSGNGNGNGRMSSAIGPGTQAIKPGEYAVEPLEK